MLKTRLLTALIGIPIVLFLVWSGGIAYSGAVILLALVALYELASSSRNSDNPVATWLAFLLFFLAACVLISPKWGVHRTLASLWFLPIIALVVGVMFFADRNRLSLNSIALTFLSANYTALFIFLISLRFFPQWGQTLTFAVLLGVWAGDSAAYFIGKSIGKHPLTPLSPKKTMEGTFAGFVASIAVGIAFCLHGGMPWQFSMTAGILIALTAPLGDLIASYWKREMGAKDFGAVFPGHGGVMDRCDSLILSAFAVYLLATWML